MKRALINLVSKQTLQNVLPIMAIRPECVGQCVSTDKPNRTAFAVSSASVKHAVQAAGLSVRFEADCVLSEMPRMQEVYAGCVDYIEHFRKQRLLPIVNITGGTKLMSIGAYKAARDCQVPALYCDTQERRMIWLDTAAPACELPDWENLAQKMTVKVMMAAHGRDKHDYKTSRAPDAALRRFAAVAHQMRSEYPVRFAAWQKEWKAWSRPAGNGKIPKKGTALKRLLEAALPAVGPELEPYYKAASAAGLLQEISGGYRLDCCRYSVAEVVKLMEATWYEVYVYGLLENNSDYGDIRWSVEPVKHQGADYGETDLLCVNRKKLSLTIISCKSWLTGLNLEHAEALRERSDNLGGKFSDAWLTVFRIKDEVHLDSMIRTARKLGVELLVGEHVAARLNGK